MEKYKDTIYELLRFANETKYEDIPQTDDRKC